MIKLKSRINKSDVLRTIRRGAEKRYKDTWQPELQVEAYVKGAEALLNNLQVKDFPDRSAYNLDKNGGFLNK